MALSITVGISDARVSRDPDSTLVTYALGSCIAVAAYDPVTKCGGLLHFMLPDSAIATDRDRLNPFMYGDTGVPLLIEQLGTCGASKHRLQVSIAGGAQVVDDKGFFNIGKRNHASVRKALWKAGLLIKADATGGTVSRTVWMDIGTGQIKIKEGAGLPRQLDARGQGGITNNANTCS